MLVNENRFELVASSFYEAAAVPDLWPKALEQLAEASGSAGAMLIPFPTADPYIPCSAGVAELLEDFVKSEWTQRNSRGERGAALLTRDPAARLKLHSDTDLFTVEELAREPFHQEFLRPRGFSSFLGGSLADLDRRFVYVDLERKSSVQPYSVQEKRSLQKLFPDLKKAGLLAIRVGLATSQAALAGLDAVGCAAALLDASGRIVRANGRFEALCGDEFRIVRGSITVTDHGDNKKLQALIAAALHGGAGRLATVALKRPGLLPLLADTLPLSGAANDVFGFGKLILILSDPQTPGSLQVNTVREVFKLTRAEAQLAIRVAEGQTIENAAEELRITSGTARIYLKSVFAKTDTHRQAELAMLLSRFRMPSGLNGGVHSTATKAIRLD